MGNPFDGTSQVPIGNPAPVYHHDPQTGILWQADPAGYGWMNLGWRPPAWATPPLPIIPPPLIAGEFTDQAMVHASATQVAKDAVNYNKAVYMIWESKFQAWQTQHKGDKPKSPVPYYRIADYNTLVMIIAAGLAGERQGKPPAPVPMPPAYE